MIAPRYPVYVPSKGRAATCLTPSCLASDGVAFSLVVEPAEIDGYAERFRGARILALPRDGMRLVGARNWIKEHATKMGHARHWQLDDNLTGFYRPWRGKAIRCAAGVALAATEDFVDRYENVAVSGLNYTMFYVGTTKDPPFRVNQHVYSCTLVLNAIPHRWRLVYNDDTDFCLQMLADGWCTLLMNAFLVDKKQTMTMQGGNTALYQGDGRAKMARSLERMWPGVVDTRRKYGRPQHVIKNQWAKFDTPLKLRPGLDLESLRPNEYGMELKASQPVESPALAKLVAEYNERHPPVGKRSGRGRK